MRRPRATGAPALLLLLSPLLAAALLGNVSPTCRRISRDVLRAPAPLCASFDDDQRPPPPPPAVAGDNEEGFGGDHQYYDGPRFLRFADHIVTKAPCLAGAVSAVSADAAL